MTVRTVLSPAALCLLVACNKGPTVEAQNAKPSEVANAVAAAGGADSFISPGKWETTTKVEVGGMPGMANMPPEVAKQMQAAMNKTTTTTSCLTADQVKKPGPEVFAGADKRCTYDHFTMSGGKIDAKMSCDAGGGKMTMTMVGSYTADHYTAQNTMEMSGAGRGMTTRATIDSRRVGDCEKS